MALSDFYFKRLGKMIEDPSYDLSARYALKLLDEGFIDFEKKCIITYGYHMCFSFYFPTQKGKNAYQEWKNNANL